MILLLGVIGWFLLLSPLFASGVCQCLRGCECGKKKKSILPITGGLIFSKKFRRRLLGKGASNKAEERAADLARQAQAESAARGKELETKFLRTPEEQAILEDLRKRSGLSGEALVSQLGPTSAQLVDLIRQRLTTPQQIPFESTLAPALRMAQERVTALANQRGIVGSGLELEHLGRAGVDLAIQEAQARQQNSFINQQLIQEALDRAAGLTQFGAGLSEQALGDVSGFEQALREQELRGTLSGANIAEAGEGRKAGFEELGLQSLSQREQQARARNAAIAQALGSAALGGVTGGFGLLPGQTPGGFNIGRALQGFGQSVTGTGAFGLQGQLDALRQAGLLNTQRLSRIPPPILTI